MSTVTDLTGTTWYVKSGWSCPAGYGVFNINYHATRGAFDVDCDKISIGYSLQSESVNEILLIYGNTSGLTDPSDSFTMVISGGDDAKNTALINWLSEYGILQETETKIYITYNGKSATLTNGQTATLHCAGKKAVADIVAAFDSNGRITYNGKETAVEAGKTATLACAGKKMKTDVVITVAQ